MFNSLIKISAFAALLPSVFAVPALVARQQTPNDGFPNPSAQQLLSIEQAAHGTIPNTPLPPPGALSDAVVTTFRLVQFNENFEVAYFTSLLNNITNKVHGYDHLDDWEYEYAVKVLTAVVAQEELHSLTAGAVVKSQNKDAIQPCKYKFPVADFDSAVSLASTFNDLVLGTLQSVIKVLSDYGLGAVGAQVGSIIGQEGEQNGLYRAVQKKIPSQLPFLTASAPEFAWTALQMFLVPGSCPQDVYSLIPINIFGALNVLTAPIEPKDQTLQFSFDLESLKTAKLPVTPNWTSGSDFASAASLVYINGQNLPVVTSLKSVQVSGSVVKFSADFPFSANLLHGFTIAAITLGSGPFENAAAVANATVFGPGLIEID